MPDQAHHWGLAVIVDLDESAARQLAATDLPERIETAQAWAGAGNVRTVRGPLCAACGVTWRVVHRQPDKPWPCPGKRPEELGGSPIPSGNHRRKREATRRSRREAQRQGKPQPSKRDPVKDAIEASIWRAAGSARQRREEAAAATAGMDALGQALADADELEGFLA